MFGLSQFLSLPLPVLLLILSTSANPSPTAAPEWPYNLPDGTKYYPQDEKVVKRALAAHSRIAHDVITPVGMRRLSPDPNEMFYLDYWTFDDDYAQPANGTANGLLPPLLPHMTSPNPQYRSGMGLFGSYAAIAKRDFQCPSGYSNCASIGRQYSCCASSSSCVIVQDTGLGDVGCCPSGAACGNSVGSCSNGYKSCPGSSNGGCCMPGFDCLDVGCISVSTTTTTTTLPISTAQASCTNGFKTCPASLGGGCCASSLTCGSSNACVGASTSTQTVTPTTTATAVVPVRPTTDSSSNSSLPASTTPTIITTGTQLVAICPTNYYFCSAYYRPGCCQIGRDCAMTNCPAATASSTFVSNGVTVVVPIGGSTGGSTYVTTAIITGTGAAATFGGGPCADGWNSCAQSIGGGCCMGGFTCGASCTGGAQAGTTSIVPKVAPGGAGLVNVNAWILGIGFSLILLV